MVEKVKLTREQVDAIEKYKSQGHNLAVFVAHGKTGFHGELEPLRTLSIDEMGRLLYEPDSYEVEPEYKVGDWIVFESVIKDLLIGRVEKVSKTNVDTDYIGSNGYKQNFSIGGIRHASYEEVRVEKERRVWAKTGREVGEFRDGDFVINSQDVLIRVDSDNKAIRISERYSNRETFKGFFPSESFISFEGLEGDSDD